MTDIIRVAGRDHDLAIAERLEDGLALLYSDAPQEGIDELMRDYEGIEALHGRWSGLALALATPAGWDRVGLHDQLLALKGYPPGTDVMAVGDFYVLASLRLLITNVPDAGEDSNSPLDAGLAEAITAKLRGMAEANISRLAARMSLCQDPDTCRANAVEAACIDVTPEGLGLLRYEAMHDRVLRTTLSQLIQLTKTGADLVEDAEVDPQPALASCVPDAPNEATPEAASEPIAPNEATPEVPILPSRAVERDRSGRVWPISEVKGDLLDETVDRMHE